MADATEEKVKATAVPVLLSIIAGLLALFGTVSTSYLSKMNAKLDNVVTSDAVQNSEIARLREDQAEIKSFYQEAIKSFARKEDEITIKKTGSMKSPTTVTVISVFLTVLFSFHLVITTWAAIKANNWEVVNANGNTIKDILIGGVVGYYFVRSHSDKPKEEITPLSK